MLEVVTDVVHLDKRLLKTLRHKCTYYELIGKDKYGDKDFAPGVEVACYRSGKVTRVVSLEGVETTSFYELILNGVYRFKDGDQVEFEGEKFKVLNFSHYDGLFGNAGTTVVYL